MTMDERIEAAARAHDPELFVHPLHEPGQCEYCDEERAHARKHIREIIAAAFPELTGDKPTHVIAPHQVETLDVYKELVEGTHWLAPWEATEEIEEVLDDKLLCLKVSSTDHAWGG